MVHHVLGLLVLVLLPIHATSQSSCGGPCNTLDDCAGQLICINGKCDDDPDVGTHTCGGGGGGGGGGGSCQASGSLTCPGGKPQTTYRCSPPVTSSTPALLTNNDFGEGGDGGGPSECDEQYHPNERVVALSTGWYAGGSKCGRMIRITAQNGRSTTAKVVDECDSQHGCDKEHAFQGPCRNNVVDGSNQVWNALGLNIDDGVVPVTWSIA